MKLLIGSHVSFKKNEQLLGSVKEALSYNANSFMIYTGAPQNTSRMDINAEFTNKAFEIIKENNLDVKNIIVHAPYIVNLANPSLTMQEFAVSFLRQEIKRCEELGIINIVIHPGSHVKFGIDQGIENIIKCLNKIIDINTKVNVCLETMSGKGSECGYTFTQLKKIIDGVIYKDKIKVCLDTCHMHDSGYDLKNFDLILDEFDEIIGIEKIVCVHLNDSKNEIGMKKDRHANIGFDVLLDIIYNKRLENVPKILETPYISHNEKSFPPYKFEIEMIKEKIFNPNLILDIINYYNN